MKMKIRSGANLTVKSIVEFFENIKKKRRGFCGMLVIRTKISDCNTDSGIKKQNQGF